MHSRIALAPADQPAEEERRVNVVQIDGQVLLKIIKTTEDNTMNDQSGLLLGIQMGSRLEVTNCFPTPQALRDDDPGSEKYQTDMLHMLERVNVDNNTVGWFLATSSATLFSTGTLEDQYGFQKNLGPNAILLLVEPYRRGSGRLNVKAYRLTDSFMARERHEGEAQGSFARNVDNSDILEEIRLQVHNSHLVHAFLYELRDSKVMSTDRMRLDIHVNPYVEQHLESLGACIDEYTIEMGKFHYVERAQTRNEQLKKAWTQKRAADNELREKQGKQKLPDDSAKQPFFKPVPKHPKVDTFLITNRMTQLSNSVLADSTNGFSKMYVVDALHR